MINLKAIKSTNKTLIRAKNALGNTQKALRNSLHEIGAENVRYLRKLIYGKPKTGRLYMIGGKLHRASAPGEAPANLTGALAKSADYTVTGHNYMEFGEGEPYGLYLEEGTEKIAPRPHVGRTVKERETANHQIIRENTKRL